MWKGSVEEVPKQSSVATRGVCGTQADGDAAAEQGDLHAHKGQPAGARCRGAGELFWPLSAARLAAVPPRPTHRDGLPGNQLCSNAAQPHTAAIVVNSACKLFWREHGNPGDAVLREMVATPGGGQGGDDTQKQSR